MSEETNLIFEKDDFRYKRYLLPAEAFALNAGDDSERDIVDKEVWRNVISLPDDVSLRTSGNFGMHLKAMTNLVHEWIDPIPAEVLDPDRDPASYTPPPQTPTDRLILDMYEQFNACIFNALTGWYWIAIGCLRGALELSVVAAYFEIQPSQAVFDNWYNGGEELKFGNLCDHLGNASAIRSFETDYKSQHSATVALFDQRNPHRPAGLVRSIFSSLSDSAHTRPHVAASRFWEGSNGPVFVVDSFIEVYRCFLEVVAISRIILTLGKSGLRYPDGFELLLAAPEFTPHQIIKFGFEKLWGRS